MSIVDELNKLAEIDHKEEERKAKQRIIEQDLSTCLSKIQRVCSEDTRKGLRKSKIHLHGFTRKTANEFIPHLTQRLREEGFTYVSAQYRAPWDIEEHILVKVEW